MQLKEAYYVRELEAPEGYIIDNGIYTVTVRAGLDTYVNQGKPVVNTRMGRLQVFKKDKMGSLGAGYVFGIYSDEACTALVQTITTDDTGSAVSGFLAPGTYYVKETALPDTDTVHTLNTQTVTVTVRPGATVKAEVINAFKKGTLGVLKSDDIGTPLAGAVFGIYFDQECTSSASVPIRTNADGIGTKQMDVGTYYIREVKAPEGHIMDDNVYCITVVADETVYINSGEPVVNIRMGRLRLLKQDKFGTLGAGFEFTLYADYKCTEPVSVFSTDSNGIAISDWLPEGRYYLKETKLPEDTIHVLGTLSYTIDIYTGEITEVTFTNSLQQGNIGVRKTDDAGTPMSGIVFGVYSDPDCTKLAAVPFRTNENGIATTSLEPGDYYVREITRKPEYVLDQRIYPVTVIAGTTTYINNGDPVINTRKGKIELIKKDPEGILGAGYVFGIYADEACTEPVQTITTDDTGTAISDWLNPNNTYYIKEISLPEDDTLHAVSDETLPIEVLPGETGQVSIVNEFLPGQITVLKVSQEGQKLSGAKFLLEWSEDGQSWQRATLSDSATVIKGNCSSEDLADGCLITGEDGIVTFNGLHPKLHYLYTEQTLQEVCLGIHSMCVGSESVYFNGHSNITDDAFLVFGVKGLMDTNKRLKDAMLFNILSYMSNQLLGQGNTAASIDELYLFLTNMTAIEYIRNASKRVRKKESSVILASQNIEDFLLPTIREMTKPLFSIPTHQFLFNPGQINPKEYMDALQVEASEFERIKYPERGTSLFRCGNERYLLEVHAPDYKVDAFGKAGGR